MHIRLFSFLFFTLQGIVLLAQSDSCIVNFESGEYKLSAVESQKLDAALSGKDNRAKYHITITGFTDSIGNEVYNQDLSLRRAKTVKDIISTRLPLSEFELLAMAYYEPIAGNETEIGRSKNRRVLVFFEKKETAKDIWTMQVQTFKIHNQIHNVLETKNKCRIVLEPNSFISEDSDSVRIQVTEYNDPIDFLAGGLPMSYEENNQTILFQSEQMMRIEASVDGKPVLLNKMMKLQCPEVDTSNGVRLYKFNPIENEWADIRYKFMEGHVDTIPILPDEEKPEDEQQPEKERASDPKSSGSVKAARKTTSSSAKRKTKSKAKRKGGGSGKKSGRKRKSSSIQPEIRLDPDTGSSFILEPDTSGRAFFAKFKSKIKHYGNGGSSGLNSLLYCRTDCDSSRFDRLMALSELMVQDQINLPAYVDYYSYNERYKSFKYDGMELKQDKNKDDWSSVALKVKKRFLRRQLVLEIIASPENPEYTSLEGAEWRVPYGKEKDALQVMRSLHVSDMRITKMKRMHPNQIKKKKGYSLEFKDTSSFYRMVAYPKNVEETNTLYKSYIKRFIARVNEFNDSIFDIITESKLDEIYCFYKFMDKLTKLREPRHCPPYYCVNPLEGEPSSQCSNCELQPNSLYGRCSGYNCFESWVKFYNNHVPEIKQRVQMVKAQPELYFSCACIGIKPCVKKWNYLPPVNNGLHDIIIGLGIYNFDREVPFSRKQRVNNPVFMLESGDTITTCSSVINAENTVVGYECPYSIYSIISGINGLLKHSYLPTFNLLPDQLNVIFLRVQDKKYKTVVDLRDGKQYEGNVFIMKDISKEGNTLEGLRKELLNFEKN